MADPNPTAETIEQEIVKIPANPTKILERLG
jgi:hypothetical protein